MEGAGVTRKHEAVGGQDDGPVHLAKKVLDAQGILVDEEVVVHVCGRMDLELS